MRFRVLGPVEVVAADGTALAVGGPKQGTMLATLIAGSGRVVPTDRLLQAMYGEDVSTNSRATMFTYVSTLRRTLGDVIVRRGDGSLLQCACADAAIDAVEFEDACQRWPRRSRRASTRTCVPGATTRSPTRSRWSTPSARSCRRCTCSPCTAAAAGRRPAGTDAAHDGSVQGLAISGDGLLATSSGNVRLWSPDSRLSRPCPRHPLVHARRVRPVLPPPAVPRRESLTHPHELRARRR